MTYDRSDKWLTTAAVIKICNIVFKIYTLILQDSCWGIVQKLEAAGKEIRLLYVHVYVGVQTREILSSLRL